VLICKTFNGVGKDNTGKFQGFNGFLLLSDKKTW